VKGIRIQIHELLTHAYNYGKGEHTCSGTTHAYLNLCFDHLLDEAFAIPCIREQDMVEELRAKGYTVIKPEEVRG
jgi:hypothetical protein